MKFWEVIKYFSENPNSKDIFIPIDTNNQEYRKESIYLYSNSPTIRCFYSLWINDINANFINKEWEINNKKENN